VLSCQQNKILMHGDLDGELDLVQSIQVQAHLGQCKSCEQTYKNYLALRCAISTMALTKPNYDTCKFGSGSPVILRFADIVGEFFDRRSIGHRCPLSSKYYI